jgi:tetratricopeptide (TPR) repeat protein
MGWLQDLFGKKSAATTPVPIAIDPHADAACSFCGRPRLQVRRLIAGPNRVYICETCIEDAAAAADEHDEDAEGPVAMAQAFLFRRFQHLGEPTDLVESALLVDAALALAAGDGAVCRRIADAAVGVHDPASAMRAQLRIPEPLRTLADRVNEALLHDQLGDTEAAIVALDALDDAALTGEYRLIVPLHRASLRLAAGLVKPDEARAFAALADEVLAALPTLGVSAAYAVDVRREILLARARAAHVLGDLDRARALLEAHVAEAADGVALAVLYEVHLARGDRAAARAAKDRALASMHPENALANKLRARRP